MNLTTALLMGAGTTDVPVLRNYVIPGLDSYLIREMNDGSKIRLFHMTRHQNTMITPHSHRFGLNSYVLAGEVENIVWGIDINNADPFSVHRQTYLGEPGKYRTELVSTRKTFSPKVKRYSAGQDYWMSASTIHSICFSKGALVLIHEGVPVSDTSLFIEPFENSQTIPLMKPEGWMFKPGASCD